MASFIKNITLREVIGDRYLSGNIFNITQVDVNNRGENFKDSVILPSPLNSVINLTLTLGSALFFTFVTFLKLKEKEV